MNTSKFVLAGIAGGVVIFLLGYLTYGMLLMDFFTTHADPVKRQSERKAAQKAAAAGKMVKSDAEWTGSDFVKQSDALAR